MKKVYKITNAQEKDIICKDLVGLIYFVNKQRNFSEVILIIVIDDGGWFSKIFVSLQMPDVPSIKTAQGVKRRKITTTKF